MSDKTPLEKALDFASAETRYWVIDALACMFHNEGNTLSGNTEVNDVEWFARDLYSEYNGGFTNWDSLSEDIKTHWRKTAKVTLSRLPYIVSRIVARYQAISSALEVMERLERAAKEKAKFDI